MHWIRKGWTTTLAFAFVLVIGFSGADSGTAGAQPRPCWDVNTGRSQLVVHVRPAGLFSGRLHAHHFVPARWNGSVCFDPETSGEVELELTVAADSLQDRQPELSREDIETVERQVRGPEVLDAANHAVIRYRADRLAIETEEQGSLTGTLHGELSLHGRTRRVDVPVAARWTEDRLRATGTVEFNQSDFGIEPYSRFLGTVSVQDRVAIEFAIDAEPQEGENREALD